MGHCPNYYLKLFKAKEMAFKSIDGSCPANVLSRHFLSNCYQQNNTFQQKKKKQKENFTSKSKAII
jgi:hypothetical protein